MLRAGALTQSIELGRTLSLSLLPAFYLRSHPITELSVDTARDDKMTINVS